jgi:hypothetical protein
MRLGLLAIGMLLLLMMSATVYGAIMETPYGKNSADGPTAGAVFIILGGFTFIAFLVWGMMAKLVPSPVPM